MNLNWIIWMSNDTPILHWNKGCSCIVVFILLAVLFWGQSTEIKGCTCIIVTWYQRRIANRKKSIWRQAKYFYYNYIFIECYKLVVIHRFFSKEKTSN